MGEGLEELERSLAQLWERKWKARIVFLKSQAAIQRHLLRKEPREAKAWNAKRLQAYSTLKKIREEESELLAKIRKLGAALPQVSDELVKLVGFKLVKTRLFGLPEWDKDLLTFFNDVKSSEDKVGVIQGRLEEARAQDHLESFLEGLEIRWWKLDGRGIEKIPNELERDRKQILEGLEGLGSYVEGWFSL